MDVQAEASHLGPSVDWQQHSLVHVIWRVPGDAPLPAKGKSPAGNPLCLLLCQQHDTMIVMQVRSLHGVAFPHTLQVIPRTASKCASASVM